jgi:L-iditol 2-dehydrogenase
MATMRAAVWTGGNDFPVQESAVPEPGPGQVLVRVAVCGVCMTDVHTVEGKLAPSPPPRVLGHEWGGVIEAVGPGVSGLEPGTRVAGAGSGGYGEQIVAATERVFPIPQGAALDETVFVEPLACCIAAVESARLPVGGTALVTGAGPMGLLTLLLARRGGAARVIVSEPSAHRRAVARELAAAVTIDPLHESLADAVAELTRGRGVDAALETAGHPAPLGDCLDAVADGGTVVMVGVNPATARLELPLYRFHRRNLTLRGSYGAHGTGDFRAAVNWLGELHLAPIISHRFPLAQVGAAFDLARTGSALKVIVEV